MQRFLYDGTAEGLMSAIEAILEAGADPERAELVVREDTLFEEGLFLRTDPAAAESLFSRLRQRAPDAVHTLWYFVMSEAEGLEASLLRYVALALRHGDRINGYLTNPDIKSVVAASRKAGRELHRMKGLLRFEQMRDGSYLAKMEPDHDIIRPLARHFTRRLGAQAWFILDARRSRAAHWDGRELRFGSLEQFSRPDLSDDELHVQAMWRTFFSAIAIPERKNPRLQKSCMPAKYWKYLTEKQGE